MRAGRARCGAGELVGVTETCGEGAASVTVGAGAELLHATSARATVAIVTHASGLRIELFHQFRKDNIGQGDFRAINEC